MTQFNADVLAALEYFCAAKDLTPQQQLAATLINSQLEAERTCPQEELERLRQTATDRYGSVDLIIDPLSSFDLSEGDGGTWVRAWVWIPEEDEE
jgi:hypothetical protein